MKQRALNGRLRTYAYGIVTTALVLAFALAESATEKFVSDRSRLAGTALEVLVIVAATLAFRPLHRRVEAFIDDAFTKRRREAREMLHRLRRELTSFNDAGQILRRIVEAVDHHMAAASCAVYLRREAYTAEASSFDVPAEPVEPDDALIVRLRSSSDPANPHSLGSKALGDLAFPMMAAGQLVGFITLTPKHAEYDVEDRQALAALGEAAGLALLALDPRLRLQEPRALQTRPNNLPRQSTSFVGRSQELTSLAELVRSHGLVTIVGTGGIGKTRLAIQTAGAVLEEFADGAWFVDLSPVSDGNLVASAILSAVGARQAEDGDPVQRVVEHLKERSLVLLLDNCEHLIGGAARAAAAIHASCPKVVVLATSREPLGLAEESVHRPSALDEEAALQLFTERAHAVNARFQLTEANRALVADVCRRIDGIALGIELAAARIRSISLEELSRRLELRVLGGSGREPVARHQTMHALIDWSYDLLTEDEKRLFAQLSVFGGGVTLEAAGTACPQIDDWRLLDLVTSLVDKSLLVADVGEATQRYRYLESIRAYARERLDTNGETAAMQRRHALAMANLAERAYEEFDGGPGSDWLERYDTELDNVRAALEWALADGGDVELAARIAGSYGVVFLRSTLLQEGTEWCLDVVRANVEFAPSAAARLHYVLAMLWNNQGRFAEALGAAQTALEAYRRAGDGRGIVRALSQVGQQLVQNGRREDALPIAEQAVSLARSLGDDGVLAGVLARCADTFKGPEFEKARACYAESASLYAKLGRDSERARTLWWWSEAELGAGNARAAVEPLEEARAIASGELQMWVTSFASTLYWQLDERDRAARATRGALLLAADRGHAIVVADAIGYTAMIAAETDPREAARLFGYATERQARLAWSASERRYMDAFAATLRERLGGTAFDSLCAEGARWSDAQALAHARAI